MAELKTKPTKLSAAAFLKTVEPKEKRDDALVLLKLFQTVTGEKPVMWGTSIVGFGRYHYESMRSAQKGDWPLVGFSPRKQNLSLYIMHGNQDSKALFQKLGKHKTSGGMGGCLYIKHLADVDQKILTMLIKASFRYMKKTKM